jgi:Bacterial Ig-like domain
VVAEFPRDGERNVSVFTDVLVKFSESVRGVDEHSFTLRSAFSGKRVSAFVFQRSSSIYALRPDFRLRSFTRYVVTVEGGRFGIRDRAGNKLFDEHWTFATGRDRRFGGRAGGIDFAGGVDSRTVRALAEPLLVAK